MYVVKDPCNGEFISVGDTKKKALDRFLTIKHSGGTSYNWCYYKKLGYSIIKITLKSLKLC